MNDELLVCPQCGHRDFTADLPTLTQFTYAVHASGQLLETASEVVDGGDDGDIDTLECTDCGEASYPDDLLTPEAYDQLADA